MISRRFLVAFKALRQMGLRPMLLYGLYRFGLQTGHYRRLSPGRGSAPGEVRPEHATLPAGGPVFPLPAYPALEEALGESRAALLAEADEICAGKVRLFGAGPVPLILSLPGPLKHWTAYERGELPPAGAGGADAAGVAESGRDIKFVWEPGRFGWAFPLGRAFYLSRDPRYALAFWEASEEFLRANPPGLGPHWASAQEVALRLIALVFAAQVFAGAPGSTPGRQAFLAQAVADHAARIPPTLVYARSQNNNHLLSEAAGLYTAGVFLSGHPAAAGWQELGWRWLHWGFGNQIAPDGAYTQNSTNYHRLMLQVALWAQRVARAQGRPFPDLSRQRLEAATRWLIALVDRQTGRVPNLGPNDGACILPLAAGPFSDYRPVLQAAGQVFLGEHPFPAGPWDEMALWLGDGAGPPEPLLSGAPAPEGQTPHILRSPSGRSWAYFRIARHTTRPGHADQLHLDLWWRGLNAAQDAGTYLYNGSPPWENALASTFVHNTVTVDGQEQMERVGRFLWLDWAQGQVLSGEPAGEGEWRRLRAQQDGYRRLGILHQRQVFVLEGDRWVVEDQLERTRNAAPGPRCALRLHWLLPDWPWELAGGSETSTEILLSSPSGPVELRVLATPGPGLPPQDQAPAAPLQLQIARAGVLLYGRGQISPTWGWVSPSYGQKEPGLSLGWSVETRLPFSFTSQWSFPA